MPDIERRRAAAAAAWEVGDAAVLVAAGDEIPVPGRGDRTYPYRAHSEYLYLTDRERPGGVLAFDPGEGWIEFVVPVTAEELLWTGLEGDREGVPEGTRPRDELEGWLFESIVAAGDHSAVLHFAPTLRELEAGQLLLVDAGAEYRGYAATSPAPTPSAASSVRSSGSSGRPSAGPGRPRSPRAGPAWSGARCTGPPRSSPPRAW